MFFFSDRYNFYYYLLFVIIFSSGIKCYFPNYKDISGYIHICVKIQFVVIASELYNVT